MVAEEHELRDSGAVADQHGRLRSIEAQLDQCWDLLRQRRARKEFGEDPGDAEPRSTGNVEGYLQYGRTTGLAASAPRHGGTP